MPRKKFDVVLVDAPCTGLGAARRNPEVKYIEGAGSHPQTQRSLLSQAADTVKPGGFLFYAVCTMTSEETSQVIEEFVQKSPFSCFVPDEFMYKKYLQPTSSGFITIIPQGDIFFLSVLKKPEE
jgi:16S rRNA (cytosine967-C5)-methyltransferase